MVRGPMMPKGRHIVDAVRSFNAPPSTQQDMENSTGSWDMYGQDSDKRSVWVPPCRLSILLF